MKSRGLDPAVRSGLVESLPIVAGSLLWGMVFDGFRPDRWDVIGSAVCVAGVAVIMYVPRS